MIRVFGPVSTHSSPAVQAPVLECTSPNPSLLLFSLGKCSEILVSHHSSQLQSSVDVLLLTRSHMLCEIEELGVVVF